MRGTTKHVAGILVIAVFLVSLIGSSSKKHTAPVKPPTMKTGTFKVEQKKDEIFTKQATAQMLRATKNPSIVLRVPTPRKEVAESESQTNNTIYNTIEKEFAKAGYVVRDRALFAKVLEQQMLEQEVLDYRRIGGVTATDLILELISFTRPQYAVTKYTDESGAEQTSPRELVFNGAQIEFKLISVRENDLVGAYTFNYAPCTEGCSETFNADQSSPLDIPSEVPLDFFKEAALRLIAEMRPTE